MSRIYDLFERIAATSKRTEKESILKSVIGTDLEQLVKNTLIATYDNRINYWIKEFPFPEEGSLFDMGEEIEFQEALDLLASLSTRQVTGNSALSYATQLCAGLEREEAILLDRVIKRDLRAGMTSGTANKIWPGLIYEHPYMRCSSFNEKNLKNIKFPCFSQTKADGLYLDIVVKDGLVKYMTRSGQVLAINSKKNDDFLGSIADDFVLMGEGLVSDGNGGYLSRKEGNGILNSDRIDLDKVVFKVWDYVPHEEWVAGKGKTTYQDRFSCLEAVLKDAPSSFSIVDTQVVNTVQEVIDHFKEEVEKGEEGTVVKDFSGLWSDGTSKHQVKVKIEFECDLKIKSYKEGSGKHKGRLGAFGFESAEGIVEVSVGGGYSDKQREEMWLNRDSYLDTIATVRANDLIQNRGTLDKYSLFLPRFIEPRQDKTEADSFERVKQQRDDFIYTLKAMES